MKEQILQTYLRLLKCLLTIFCTFGVRLKTFKISSATNYVKWAVAVGKFAERLLPISEVSGSIPDRVTRLDYF